jgi:hypothetical protein
MQIGKALKSIATNMSGEVWDVERAAWKQCPCIVDVGI